MEAPPMRKLRVTQRRRPAIPADEEGDECDDVDDEDFAPDEDEDDEEEIARVPVRKAGCGKSKPVKVQRRRGRPRNSIPGEKRTKAPTTKKRRRTRIAVSSDDDDVVVRCRRRISVEATAGEKKKKRGRISGGRKRRRSWMSISDQSDSDSSDFDYAMPDGESRDLRVQRPLVRRPMLSLDFHGKKGKGKDDGDLGKQVCGICFSEEKKAVLRGLLDCCAHYFCFACIMEWSKVESRCPLCKRRFRTVRKTASPDAGFCPRTAVIKIPERDQVYQPSEEEIRGYLDPYANVVCMECQQGGDDNLMLLCDICDSPAHTYCVGLGREVPEGNWYCDGCRPMDLVSSNSRFQQSVVEQRITSDVLNVNSHCGIDSENAPVYMPHEPSQQLATQSCQLPSDRIGEDASGRRTSPLEGHETALRVPGFSAATVSGRRSIHHHIRIMISNNRVRWVPEGVARNSVIQPSSVESVLSYTAEQHRETFCVQQESLPNGMDERSSRPFLGSRVNMLPCTNNEGSSYDIMEGAKEFTQW